jgi:hypothetical protein
MVTDRAVPGDRFQVRLADLVMAVLGSAFVLDVARRSRAAWGGGMPDAAHALGLIALSMGVGLALVVARQGARRLGGRGGASRAHWAWGLAWRAAAVGWLAWSILEVSGALETAPARTGAAMIVGWHAEMRLRLIPLMTSMGMVGLVLAATPLRGGPPRVKPARRSWPSVILAGLAGVLVVAAGHGMIPYLLLLAMEAVRNAMTRAPLIPHPSLFDRLATAGLESLPVLAACLATAIWVDDDLRAAARDPVGSRAPRSWAGVLVRLATAASAAAGGGYILLVTVPRLSPNLSDGLADVIEPASGSTIVLGFAVLAAGLSARSAALLASGAEVTVPGEGAARTPGGLGPWPRRIIGMLGGLVALEITAAAVQAIRRDLEYRWYIPVSLHQWLDLCGAWQIRWLFGPSTFTGWNPILDRPGDLLIIGAALWLASRLVMLLASKGSGRPSPLDAIAADRLALGRFLGWWAGLTILMLASLPAMAVAGVSLTHLVIRWVAG